MKINVIGTSGSGKSTLAKQLSQKLNLPYLEMDKIFWRPDWQQPPDEIFFSNLKTELQKHPGWVLDGNYTRTIPLKWEKVDLVIWLDYSFTRTLFQAVKRAIHRSWTQVELWEGTGNRESFRKSFMSRESIIMWTINTHKKTKEKYESVLIDSRYSHIRFVRLKNPTETRDFLRQFSLWDQKQS